MCVHQSSRRCRITSATLLGRRFIANISDCGLCFLVTASLLRSWIIVTGSLFKLRFLGIANLVGWSFVVTASFHVGCFIVAASLFRRCFVISASFFAWYVVCPVSLVVQYFTAYAGLFWRRVVVTTSYLDQRFKTSGFIAYVSGCRLKNSDLQQILADGDDFILEKSTKLNLIHAFWFISLSLLYRLFQEVKERFFLDFTFTSLFSFTGGICFTTSVHFQKCTCFAQILRLNKVRLNRTPHLLNIKLQSG